MYIFDRNIIYKFEVKIANLKVLLKFYYRYVCVYIFDRNFFILNKKLWF